jgi:hypothetical protein
MPRQLNNGKGSLLKQAVYRLDAGQRLCMSFVCQPASGLIDIKYLPLLHQLEDQ